MEPFTLRATSLSDAVRQVSNRVTIDEELRRARHTANCCDLAFNAVLSAGSAHVTAQAEAARIDAIAHADEGDEGLSAQGLGV